MIRTTRTRGSSPTTAATRLALAGVAVSMGALGLAGPANADPMTPSGPTQVAGAPDAPAAPGEPVVEAAGPPPAPGDAAPPANFDPSSAVGRVPDEQAHYGSGSGPLGFLRDAWHQAKDPMGLGDPSAGFGAAPPPGAGPAPALPPGYVSTNAPGSETPLPAKDPNAPKPAPPPGYTRMDDGRLAPIPGYVDPAVAAAPPAYVPRHSPPPPPLLPEDPGPPPLMGQFPG